ncbi:MAG: hypothetical protein JW788_04040 [Candidatus Omnitrophica bacterium]|nr:hypothetical protein [Candidatus Omnitrophota bacterium]
MNKRGVALILCLLVLAVLFVLASSFFLKSVNENNFVKRYINSTRAFWVAEAGVAEAIRSIPASSTSGNLGSDSYEASISYRTSISSCNYYDIISTGIVNLPSGGDIRRTVHAVVKTGPIDPTKFQYGLAAANELCFGGASCNKDAEDFLDPDTCNGHPCWEEGDTTINFNDLFGYEQSEIEAIATHYTEITFPGTVSGITWVDVSDGSSLMATSDLEGDGVLIIDGDVHFGGSYEFRGIVYVLGTMDALGTFDAYGSVIVASTAGVDSINGTPLFHYDVSEITDALSLLSSSNVDMVSWREIAP